MVQDAVAKGLVPRLRERPDHGGIVRSNGLTLRSRGPLAASSR
jgi:hypothetical protein